MKLKLLHSTERHIRGFYLIANYYGSRPVLRITPQGIFYMGSEINNEFKKYNVKLKKL